MDSAHSDPLLGQVLDGKYRVETCIGAGGMGNVYRGRHLMMDRVVAIKVLAAERADDPSFARRFVREARNTFRFDHPNCVRVSDFGATPEGVLYLVMEFLEGRTVGEDLHVDGPMAAQRVVHIMRQVAAALVHAHSMGLIHRDLKPDNIMLMRRGDDPDFVKVFDFGLAKFYDEDGPIRTAMSLSPLTQKGMVFGTPEYMAPEQASAQPLSPATDLYGLGIIAYQMVTGAVPFSGDHFMKILTAHINTVPTSPAQLCPNLAIPPDLDRIIMWCLEKEPRRRPPGADALVASLDDAARRIARPVSRIPQPLASSETLDMTESREELSGVVAAHIRGHEQPFASTGQRAARRSTLLLTGLIALAFVAAGVVVALTYGGADPAAGTQVPNAGATAAPSAAPFAAAKRADPDASRGQASDVERLPDAAPQRVAPASDTGTHSPTKRAAKARTASQQRALEHVRNAEAAKRANNSLRWMSEAQSAVKQDPRNRRARILFGEALIDSGQRTRGCRELRGFREVWRRAGCTD